MNFINFKKSLWGISFIEVLVSLLLLSMVLLGADVMQVALLRESRESYFCEIAHNQLQLMSDQLHVSAKKTDLKEQITEWNRVNAMLLPQGAGDVSGVFPVVTVTIYWEGATHADCQTKGIKIIKCLQRNILFVV